MAFWLAYFDRGVVLEALGRFDEAIADYRAVLKAQPDDPAAWNNLGNATAGRGLAQVHTKLGAEGLRYQNSLTSLGNRGFYPWSS